MEPPDSPFWMRNKLPAPGPWVSISGLFWDGTGSFSCLGSLKLCFRQKKQSPWLDLHCVTFIWRLSLMDASWYCGSDGKWKDKSSGRSSVPSREDLSSLSPPPSENKSKRNWSPWPLLPPALEAGYLTQEVVSLFLVLCHSVAPEMYHSPRPCWVPPRLPFFFEIVAFACEHLLPHGHK